MRGGARAIVFAASVGVLAGCSSGVTASKLAQIKPGMTSGAVQALLGPPARIDHSETADQTISGEVDHYPASTGEGRVVYINGVVFRADLISGGKS